jgi:cysteine synthase A
MSTATGRASRIEGIGRPRVETSFVPTIVDRMICVPDAGSLAAVRHLERITGRRAGGSTGTNLVGAFTVVAEMLAAGRTGSVVTLLCDGGERYAHTYYDDGWLAAHDLDLTPWTTALETFRGTGEWRPPSA